MTFDFSPEAINAAHTLRIEGRDIRDVLGKALAIELAAGRLAIVPVPETPAEPEVAEALPDFRPFHFGVTPTTLEDIHTGDDD